MQFALFLLAVAGFLAVLRRLGLAVFRALKGGVDAFVLREVASSRAQRGDVSGLLEARDLRRSTRSTRLRSITGVLVWAAALAVPLLTRTPLPIYAAFSLLWLSPLLRRRLVS